MLYTIGLDLFIMAKIAPYSLELERQLNVVFSRLGRSLAPKLGYNKDQSHPILTEMPIVRAVDRNGKAVSLRRHVNALRTGRYWPKAKIRLCKLKINEYNNYELWQEVSRLMIIIVEKYVKLPPITQIPLHWVIFRNKNDFVAGNWNVFSDYWLPFLPLMPEKLQLNILDSLQYGVDITQESQHFPFFATTKYRHPSKRLMSIPLFDVNYDAHYKPGEVAGESPYTYRPILLSKFSKHKVDNPAIFETAKQHLECQVTIGEQLEAWLKTGALQYVGHYDDWIQSKLLQYYANT